MNKLILYTLILGSFFQAHARLIPIENVEISPESSLIGEDVLIYVDGWASTAPAPPTTDVRFEEYTIVLDVDFSIFSDSQSIGVWEHTENIGKLSAGNYSLTINTYDSSSGTPLLTDSFQTNFIYPFPPAYELWVTSQNLEFGVNDMEDSDPDGDHMNNLLEYALGANPLVDDAESFLPSGVIMADGGTNYLGYVYRRRTNREHYGLDYAVEMCDELAVGVFSGATEEVGVGPIDDGFESVTNRVPLAVSPQCFMRLKVTKEE